MKNSKILSLLLIACCVNGCRGQSSVQNNSLKQISSIPLTSVSGRIDHLTFDSKNQIVFIAALGNNTVEAVDLKNRKVIYSIKNLNEPQGIVFIPGSNSLFVANGGNGECDIFNAQSFEKISAIQLAGDADNVRYDSTAQRIYVGYGDGGIAVIDTNNFKLIGDIKLSGHPESFQIDNSAKKIYVNVPNERQIEVIDLKTNTVVDKWKMREATSNFPMSLDEPNHRLFVGCRHAAKLLVIDITSGKTISSLDIDRDVDDIFYDSESRQIYLSCGGGYIDIFKQTDANAYSYQGKISTYPGARTSFFIAGTNQLLIASPSGFNREARLLVFQKK